MDEPIRYVCRGPTASPGCCWNQETLVGLEESQGSYTSAESSFSRRKVFGCGHCGQCHAQDSDLLCHKGT